jgi:GT2 family glycosyltransferase
MSEHLYTWVINSYRSLPYLKLAVESIRINAYYKNQPIIVYTENDVETRDWLLQQSDIKTIYEENEIPKGIGGGVNESIKQVQTEYFNLVHSDMYISRHYDKPLFDIVSNTEKPIVVGAWRLEPNIFNNQNRMGTVFAPPNTAEGFGAYHHDFDKQGFLNWADEFASTGAASFRKVEGVSYMMRTKYFINNDVRFAPSSFEDHMQSVLMQLNGYEFVVCGKAVVWHFGARSSHFLGQHDKLIGTSDRQKMSEQRNFKTWLTLWGEPPSYDEYGFVKVTEQMRNRYNNNRQLYDRGC